MTKDKSLRIVRRIYSFFSWFTLLMVPPTVSIVIANSGEMNFVIDWILSLLFLGLLIFGALKIIHDEIMQER